MFLLMERMNDRIFIDLGNTDPLGKQGNTQKQRNKVSSSDSIRRRVLVIAADVSTTLIASTVSRKSNLSRSLKNITGHLKFFILTGIIAQVIAHFQLESLNRIVSSLSKESNSFASQTTKEMFKHFHNALKWPIFESTAHVDDCLQLKGTKCILEGFPSEISLAGYESCTKDVWLENKQLTFQRLF